MQYKEDKMYIITGNSLTKDIRLNYAEEALNLAVMLALRFKENITVFNGKEDNKDKLIALIRGHEIKEEK